MASEGAVIGARREASVGGGHVHKVGYTSRIMKKKKLCRRKIRRCSPEVPVVLQQLFVSCKDVFKGPGTVPLTDDVNVLCHILDKMKPQDVGLSSELQFFKPKAEVKGTPRVTYTTIYKCENFSLCLFFLPATAVIPLHNHPGMTVFSKLLLGTMHIRSYDLEDPCSANDSVPHSRLRLARLVADQVLTAPCDTSVLYPTTGGNIHQFTAITPCAFIDVLGPPYSKEDGRDCSYYKDFPYGEFSDGEKGFSEEESRRHAWLEEIEVPESSKMDGIEYLGPQIQDTPA